MKILIGADKDGFELKEYLKENLKNFTVVDKTPEPTLDFVQSSEIVAKAILNKEGERAILIDKYGAGSFMCANKYKGIICAQVSDEHSAHMTIGHNDTSIISIGAGILGKEMAKNIVEAYLNTNYDGGRHQIRVDMLNKML